MRNRTTTALLMAMVFGIRSAEAADRISLDDSHKLLQMIELDFINLLEGKSIIGLEDQVLTGDNPTAVEFNDTVTYLIDRNDPDHVVPAGYIE